METLTLPEPASQLWAAKRGIIHSVPPEMFRDVIRPHLGEWRRTIATGRCSTTPPARASGS